MIDTAKYRCRVGDYVSRYRWHSKGLGLLLSVTLSLLHRGQQHSIGQRLPTMSDPIPSATADPEAVEQPLPANAEDRKAAAALNSLNTNELASDGAAVKGPSSADQEALGKAMSRLEIATGQGPAKSSTAETQKKEAEVKKKAVKIAAADVTLLVCVRKS